MLQKINSKGKQIITQEYDTFNRRGKYSNLFANKDVMQTSNNTIFNCKCT